MVRTMRDVLFLAVALSVGAAVLAMGCSSSNNPSGAGGSASSVGGAKGGTTGSGGTTVSGNGGSTVVGTGGATMGSGGMNGLGGTMMGAGGMMMGSGGAAAMGGMMMGGAGGKHAAGGMMGAGGMMTSSGGAHASGGALGNGGMMMGAGGMMMGSGGAHTSGGVMGTGGGTGASCHQQGTLTVTNSGMTAYMIDGMSNPTLTFCRGMTYTFAVNSPGHPFYIKTVQGTGTGNAFSSGVTGNGATSGDVVFAVPADAPATLFYNCSLHAAMTGTIHLVN